MAELKLVVFDVDGTLIDSLAHIKAAMGRAFSAEGRETPSEEAVRSIIGLSLFEAFDRLAPGLSDAELNALVSAYKNAFMTSETAETRKAAPLFDGARAALDRLATQNELLLGVATGKSRRGLDRMINVHNLHGYFVTTQVADDHPSKPHPSMLEQTLRDTGTEAHQAVMIGDTSFDLEMGRAAGFKTIGVKWGYHPLAALEPHADHIIDSFEHLDQTLAQLWGTA